MRRAWLVLLACALVTTTTASAQPSEQRLAVTFVSDGAGPIAHVEVVERSARGVLHRSAAWAFFAGGSTIAKALEDRVRGERRAPLLIDLPSAPAALGLSGAVDGTLVFTLDELGDWQAALAAGATLAPAPGAPAVSTSSSARLLVEPPEEVPAASARYVTRAVLYGTRGAVAGFALVDARKDAGGGSAIVLPASDGLVVEPFDGDALASGRAFVADRVEACERAAPAAVLLWPAGASPSRLVASAAPACLPSGEVIVPFAGARLEARKDVPVRAVLIERTGTNGNG